MAMSRMGELLPPPEKTLPGKSNTVISKNGIKKTKSGSSKKLPEGINRITAFKARHPGNKIYEERSTSKHLK